jgi:uncharacterized protein YfaS (alpha-2-macroglobulin family)
MKAHYKKIGYGVLVLALIVVFVFYYTTSTSQRSNPGAINPAFGEYISSYTAGVISSGSPIRIILSKDVADLDMVGKDAGKLFSFKPLINGKAVWLDMRTVEFTPDSRMTSGQTYELNFYLSKLLSVPKGLETFNYSFRVIPQNFGLAVDNILPYVKTELTRQKIEGTLSTADFAEKDAVEKMLVAQQDGKILSVSWAHASDGKQHAFTVEEVARKEAASVVLLTLDGEALGIDQTADEEIQVPALGDFTVTNVKIDQGSSQSVVIQFSDPLKEKQNLDGLIRIEGLSNLEYEIKDNEIRVYPPARQTGSKSLTLEAGIRNILDYRMSKRNSFDVQFEQVKPAVRFTGKGSILPSTDGLIMPFEAVNIKAVDVTILKIYEQNVLQFLQVNNFNGNSELRRVGSPVLKKKVSLDNASVTDFGKWNRFTLDLSTLINTEPGAIYQVRLNFRKSYLAYVCDGTVEDTSLSNEMSGFEEENWDQVEMDEGSYWDSYEDYYYGDDYDWRQRDNPCHSSYYNSSRSVKTNVIASDLGLIAKQGGDGSTIVFVNDLRTTEPVSNVQLELYDFQQQVIGTSTTGADGKATFTSKKTPFVLLAKNGNQRGYLKLNDGESLSLSNFDVGGERVDRGLKGFLYGERGVWRPGDSLYLTFLLEDKLKLLPANHPVVFEMQNPQGQITNRLVRSSAENGFYKFATATSPDDPTGNWLGRVKVGGTQFTKTLKIETVKPNRLKINLDFGVDKLTAANDNVSGNLQVNWLHGAPGKNLKAEFEVILNKAQTKFDRYPDYAFDDPTIDFYSESQTVFEGYTDEEGKATVNASISVSESAPGKLNAIFRGKVFEESGNFSIDRISIPYYPYTSFTGVRLPKGDKRGMLLTDTTQRAEIVTVDADGNPVSHNGIEMSLYKVEWRWWWDNSEDNANYMSGSYSRPVKSGKINTVNGKGHWDFQIDYPEWGRFFVKAYDPVSGHSTGKFVYIDWPGWAGRARGNSTGATMLSFSSDKPVYNIGEKANLVIPGSGQGRALVSVESGSRVIQTYWVNTQKGDNQFAIDITPEMTPNVFIHTTLLQPHSQTVNDLPIRLYGVIPIQVEDPQTHLEPVIEMPDVLEPGKEVVIKVSEKNNRDMTYTLAVVDEGLLDLTKFTTPDAWQRFYAREALGVKTWDLYDQVMGAFGGRIERLLAIGGDGEMSSKEDDSKANRFKPVVKFFGPVTLDGRSNEHRFIMPQYIGSVKTMLVAGYEGAYGKTDKATPVRKPLMVLATLPRVLGPEEKLKLPITLFSMEKSIRDVKVEVKVSGPLTLPNGSSKSVNMNGNTDFTTDFELAVKSETGFAKVEVTVSSGNYKATDVIDIEVRNPNPPVTKVQDNFVTAGKSWSASLAPIGVVGTNTATLEVSSLPPVNLGQRLKYLLNYPYGCIEQTTSSVFPQLYLDQIMVVNDQQKNKMQTNVKAAIDRLRLFVTRDGGFAYWPGGDDSDSWGSTYAGHFLVEASAKGYFVPNDMLKRWKKYQKDKAQSWRSGKEYSRGELIQAYRLYSLALAGSPELSAMNRLREASDLSASSKWMLAAAYVKAGQPEAGKSLIANVSTKVSPYQEMAYTYGSDLRDKAIILETLLMLGEKTKGFELLKEISTELSNSNSWMSTQTLAWCLNAVGSFANSEQKGNIKFTYTFNGKEVMASTELPIAQIELPIDQTKPGSLQFANTSGGSLYVSVIQGGIPARGTEEDEESNLKIAISYADTKGNPIDPVQLEQSQEFVATVTVANPGLRGAYKNLALNQIFPSGWEINNLRLEEVEDRLSGDIPTYQDIRDDRVYTYFDLAPNQRKTFKVLLTASYAGSYYLPAVSCEAMYDRAVYTRKKGKVVEVVKANVNQ